MQYIPSESWIAGRQWYQFATNNLDLQGQLNCKMALAVSDDKPDPASPELIQIGTSDGLYTMCLKLADKEKTGEYVIRHLNWVKPKGTKPAQLPTNVAELFDLFLNANGWQVVGIDRDVTVSLAPERQFVRTRNLKPTVHTSVVRLPTSVQPTNATMLAEACAQKTPQNLMSALDSCPSADQMSDYVCVCFHDKSAPNHVKRKEVFETLADRGLCENIVFDQQFREKSLFVFKFVPNAVPLIEIIRHKYRVDQEVKLRITRDLLKFLDQFYPAQKLLFTKCEPTEFQNTLMVDKHTGQLFCWDLSYMVVLLETPVYLGMTYPQNTDNALDKKDQEQALLKNVQTTIHHINAK